MRYLGIARKEQGHILKKDAIRDVDEGKNYEAVEIGGDILLMSPPLNRERLAESSIEEHRKTLDGLAR